MNRKSHLRQALRAAAAECLERALGAGLSRDLVAVEGFAESDGGVEAAFRAGVLPAAVDLAAAASRACEIDSATVLDAVGRSLAGPGGAGQVNPAWKRAVTCGVTGRIVGAAACGKGGLSGRLRLSGGGMDTIKQLFGCLSRQERRKALGHEFQLQELSMCVAALEQLADLRFQSSAGDSC